MAFTKRYEKMLPTVRFLNNRPPVVDRLEYDHEKAPVSSTSKIGKTRTSTIKPTPIKVGPPKKYSSTKALAARLDFLMLDWSLTNRDLTPRAYLKKNGYRDGQIANLMALAPKSEWHHYRMLFMDRIQEAITKRIIRSCTMTEK